MTPDTIHRQTRQMTRRELFETTAAVAGSTVFAPLFSGRFADAATTMLPGYAQHTI